MTAWTTPRLKLGPSLICMLVCHALKTRGMPEQVDGARNPKIQSIYLEKFPIHQAAFAAGGTHVIATSRRKHFYTFDLASASIEKVSGASAPSHGGFLIQTFP